MKFQHVSALAAVMGLIAPSYAQQDSASVFPSSSVLVFTTEQCFTNMGKNSRATVPTSSNTGTFVITKTRTERINPKVTVTPAPVTTTDTVTATVNTTVTNSQRTPTVISTITETQNVTSTANATTIYSTVETTTATTNYFTSTVTTASAFTPVESSLNGSTFAGKKRDLSSPNHGSLFARAKNVDRVSYPRNVNCIVTSSITTIRTTKITGTSTATVNATAPISTVTDTSTITSTSTLIPGSASAVISTTTSTITDTYTTTPATTVNVTSTTTVMESVPTAFVYDQCASNNLVNQVDGHGIATAYDRTNRYFTVTQTDNDYDCCVACANDPSCVASTFDPVAGKCSIDDSTSCPAVTAFLDLKTSTGLTISNGNCGGFNNTNTL